MGPVDLDQGLQDPQPGPGVVAVLGGIQQVAQDLPPIARIPVGRQVVELLEDRIDLVPGEVDRSVDRPEVEEPLAGRGPSSISAR